ncbi:ankyrin containing protein (ISS) [Seminavis robusta]|uniref:Ankyrin containing protein (ISS) n=1 Tax=Seminavis robusta TaxID=568900 RepID=A0A9N8E174_9STRA|nr:ankyrin containing protein (ISS) [Seminavis robusta]|eukprot:Sro547_g164260.1 ankyrin containing protein (ISS) (498) ;mRNA; f:38335-39828
MNIARDNDNETVLLRLLATDNVWVDQIFPLLDSNDSASVALVNALTNEHYKDYSPLEFFLLNPKFRDSIFSYLGMGHYAFVGPLNKNLNHIYKSYWDKTKIPPRVRTIDNPRRIVSYNYVVEFFNRQDETIFSYRPATSQDTFHSAIFCSVACAEYWLTRDRRSTTRPVSHWVCFASAKTGNQAVLQWAIERGFKALACEGAAAGGHLGLLQWLRGMDFPWSSHVYTCAAKNGHFEPLRWAHENGCPFDALSVTCTDVVHHGNLDLFKWWRNHGCSWNESTCSAAAAAGQFEILQWAHENGCPWDSRTCNDAATYGHIAILQYAHEKGCPWDWDESTCVRAACGGFLKVLQYAHEKGCPLDSRTCHNAAANGHLDILQYVHDTGRGCLLDTETSAKAAFNGNLNILKWLHQKGCPLDERICLYAAMGGHLKVLQWSHENGLPLDHITCAAAALHGHLNCLKWAWKKGCPSKYDLVDLAIIAAHEGHKHVEDWTRTQL